MKKFGYVIAALGVIAVAAPSIASAETIVVKRGGPGWHHGWHGARAEMRRDWHPHHDRVVVIKKRRY